MICKFNSCSKLVKIKIFGVLHKNVIKSVGIMFSEKKRVRVIVRILKYFKMFSSYIGISLQVNSFPFLLYTFVLLYCFKEH